MSDGKLELLDYIRKIEEQVTKLQEMIDDILAAIEYKDLGPPKFGALKGSPASVPRDSIDGGKRRSGRRKARWADVEDILKVQAQLGFTTFLMERNSNNSAHVTIDGAPVKVSRAVADLLDILKDSPTSADGMPEWLPLEDIAKKLGIDVHNVRQRVSLFRDRLFESLLKNPFHIELAGGDKEARVRLRWRRAVGSAVVTGADSL